MTRARRCGLVAAQAGCAACASAMACSTSECLASATLAWTSPVLGLNTSANRPEPPLTVLAADEVADLPHRRLLLWLPAPAPVARVRMA